MHLEKMDELFGLTEHRAAKTMEDEEDGRVGEKNSTTNVEVVNK